MIRRGEPKAVDDLGYVDKRRCPQCGGGFTPTDVVSGISTEYHCSADCAWAAYQVRVHGEGRR